MNPKPHAPPIRAPLETYAPAGWGGVVALSGAPEVDATSAHSLAPLRSVARRLIDASHSGAAHPNPTASGRTTDKADWRADPNEATRQAVHELRRCSGLTWDQMAELFSVSRRSLHFWASGRPIAREHEAALHEVLDIVRSVHRGDARRTRSALMSVEAGESPLAMLAAGRRHEARARLQTLHQASQKRPSPNEVDRGPEQPPSPGLLIGARNESIHSDLDEVRAAHPVREGSGDGP